MTLRGRLVALAVVAAVVATGAIIVLVRSRTPGCTVGAPRPALSPALRALGDFDQAYDVANVPALEDAASRAAATLHDDLIGATAEPPVTVGAGLSGLSDAVVVPLRSHAGLGPGQSPLAGLVVFLRDCQGNAYFDTVEDDASAQPALGAFPPVSREQAAAQLGTTDLRLEYQASPLRPRWVALAQSSLSLPAR
jgi:hypothetical protein